MKTITLLLGACALAALSAGTAGAGPCTTEIDNVTKLLASKDAGAGPTAGWRARPRASILRARRWVRLTQHVGIVRRGGLGRPQHPPTAAMNQATQGGGPSSQAGSSAREQHPPTAAMGQATQGGAASPQDVQSQNRGGLTAAQQAEGGRRPASDNLASVQAALSEARGFDQAGREADCMDAI